MSLNEQTTTPAVQDSVLTAFHTDARWMPAADFARMMSWSANTEKSHRARGMTPPYIKVGYAIFYRFDDVRAWLENQSATRSAKSEDAAADLLK